jgi:hypothetical protein
MLSSARRIPLRFTLIALAALAACDPAASPTAPPATRAAPLAASLSSSNGAERSVEESLYDLTGSSTQIECENGQSSELVALEGQIFERFAVIYNPSGSFHTTYHTMPVGLKGVGAVSGEEYRVKEQDHGSFGQTLTGLVGSYRQILRLEGRTSGRSFSMVVRGHYTINANGELTVEREKAIFSCDA